MLLLGVDHRSNSTVHVGESHARLPYLDVPRHPGTPAEAVVKLPDGREVTVTHRQMPGCSWSYNGVEGELRRREAVRDGLIGLARAAT